MARLMERYQKEITPQLAEKFGRKNKLSLPRLDKIVVNMGVGKALQDKIKFGVVQNREGQFVTPGLESVTAAAKNALVDVPDDLRYSLTDAPGKDSYPISGTVWAVIYVAQPPDKGQAVLDFLRWITHEGQVYTKDLDYARLPEELVGRLEKKLDQVQVGTR